MIKNKERLVAQSYNQEEDIDFDEIYALAIRLGSIHILLTYACFMNFKFYQMDVKSAFLNGFIKETICVEQTLGFEHEKFPNHVF